MAWRVARPLMRPLQDKILQRSKVADTCRALRDQGKVIGFTSGAFDILHAGHADFLQRARQQCDFLVVAVNTDDSVRQYKGDNRPLIPENQRVALVAALESVDAAFLFSERRNAANIEAIRPHLYLKAGDYQKGGLTSSEVVEKFGGKAKILPVETPVSTTAIVDRIARLAGTTVEQTDRPEKERPALPRKKSPALFVDRDGVINRDVGYLSDPAQFELLPGAGEGLRQFQDMGYRIIVVTNQGGIGLGYYSRQDFYRVNGAMFKALKPFGVRIDRIGYCPHSLADACECRKPGTGLFRDAEKECHIQMDKSVMVGDRTTDIEAARRLGIPGILVQTGAAGSDGEFDAQPDYVAPDLHAAARWVLERERQSSEA